MKDNTVTATDGSEVYTHEIYRLSDQYIAEELDNKDDIYDVSVFTGMILYISDNIQKPSNDDIELLDSIFNIYIRLCTKYKILPTLELFGMLIRVNPCTFSRWVSGEYRTTVYYDMQGRFIDDINIWRFNHKGEQYRAEPSDSHSQAVKKWKNICKNFLVNSLQNSRGTDANKIFIAKAAYGHGGDGPGAGTEPRTSAQHRADTAGEGAETGRSTVKRAPRCGFLNISVKLHKGENEEMA